LLGFGTNHKTFKAQGRNSRINGKNLKGSSCDNNKLNVDLSIFEKENCVIFISLIGKIGTVKKV
jgi:hypothetical protein